MRKTIYRRHTFWSSLRIGDKYEMDLASIVDDTERTRFCPKMDIFQYEQTHNMMQVWTGKLSELQLPVQNSAREAACTSMSY